MSLKFKRHRVKACLMWSMGASKRHVAEEAREIPQRITDEYCKGASRINREGVYGPGGRHTRLLRSASGDPNPRYHPKQVASKCLRRARE